jgi:signal transduction histidine kinase
MSSPRRRWHLHRSAVIVLVVCFVATLAGTTLTHQVLQQNERRLLTQKANEGTLILSSLLGQYFGAAGDGLLHTVAADGTVSAQGFAGTSQAMRSTASGGPGVSATALVDPSTGRVLARAGTPLLALGGAPATAALRAAAARGPLSVVGLSGSGDSRALGILSTGSPTLAAYFEMPLTPQTTYQADDGLSQASNQPFAGLDYAVYYGTPTAQNLVWTNYRDLPLTGRTVRAATSFALSLSSAGSVAGPGQLLIVLKSRSPLIGPFATAFPWMMLAFGLLSGLAVAASLERSQRQHDQALRLVDQLEERNAEVEQAVARQARAEERLRQAQRLEAVGQLAGGIAHDFNNLLAVIFSYTGFLHTAAEGQPWADDVHEVDKAARRAAELTQQLLTFSRRDLVRPDVLDIRALLADRHRLLQRTLSGDIDVVLAVPEGPVPVRADAVELDQVVMNLAVNARDAMPAGGTLTITLDETLGDDGRPLVRLVVSDTGVGMPAEVRDRALEPFFTTKEVGRGTGLGLATVYGIVTRWEGCVTLDSAPGAGTTVTVLLPRSEDAVTPAPAPVPEQRQPSGRATVLLVEDEEGVRRASCRILTEAGYDVVEAASGPEALERFGAQPVDVLVSDVVMPGGLSGPDLADQLRLLQPQLRVVLVSGYSRDHLDQRGSLPDGTQLLRKPFLATALVEAVRDTLRQGALA